MPQTHPPAPGMRYGYEALASAVADLGCPMVFGLIGEDVALLAAALEARGVKYVGVRHENQAVAMASGYSWFGERLGLAMVTGGPGFSNGLTALNTARRAATRVLLLTGASQAAVKDYPMREAAKSLGLSWLDVASTESLGEPFTTLVENVTARGVGVACLASAFADEMVDADAGRCVPTSPGLAPHDAVVLDEDVRRLADFLEQDWAVSRPVILAGFGALQAGAQQALLRLARHLGAVTATTLRAAGLLGDDPFHLGICGTYSSSLTAKILAQADCVLAFGASLNSFTTYGNSIFGSGCHIVQVDTDAEHIGRSAPVQDELAFVQDAQVFANALADELEDRGHGRTGLRTPALAEEIEHFRPVDDVAITSRQGLVDLRAVAAFLDKALPSKRNVVFDGGRHATYSIPYLRPEPGHYFLQTSIGGSIGLSLGTGIGAAIARPEAVTIVGMGDASFFMSVGDLDTAVRLGLPMVLIVGNDQMLGSEEIFLNQQGAPAEVAKVPGPSVAQVARAFGADGHEIRSLATLHELRDVLAMRPERPIVLDCRIDASVPSPSLEFAFSR